MIEAVLKVLVTLFLFMPGIVVAFLSLIQKLMLLTSTILLPSGRAGLITATQLHLLLSRKCGIHAFGVTATDEGCLCGDG